MRLLPNMRWLTDPIGWWLMKWMQDAEIEEYVQTSFANESDSIDPDSTKPSRYSAVTENFLKLFERRSKIYVILAVITLIGLFLLDCRLGGRLPNQTSGIGINFLGSVILARSALKGPYTIIAISAGYGSSNPVEKQEIGSAVDGPWGAFLILVGFAIQYVAIVGLFVPPVWCPF